MIETPPQLAALYREMEEQQKEWDELWDMVEIIEREKEERGIENGKKLHR